MAGTTIQGTYMHWADSFTYNDILADRYLLLLLYEVFALKSITLTAISKWRCVHVQCVRVWWKIRTKSIQNLADITNGTDS